MKKQQYIVFGLNRFGTSVARTLAAAGNEVVAVVQDADPRWHRSLMQCQLAVQVVWPMRMP